jgi:hypothetical protein
MRLRAWALLSVLALPVVAAQPDIGQILAELSDISGLAAPAHVHCDRIPRDRLREFLERRVHEEVKPQEIEAEEAALKKLGLAPPDFDLRKTTIDLLTEQAAAFYDFHKKRLFVVDPLEGEEEFTLVHELAHALADRHFHLEKYISHARDNDDSALARTAVMEGQAVWLTGEYEARQSGRSLKNSPELVARISAENGAGTVFDRTPRYFQKTLVFPYTGGFLFQQAVVEKMGQAAFVEVFRRPPENTQQILHPEKYFAHAASVRPQLPALPAERAYRAYTDGELGELDHSILFSQYAGAEAAATVTPEWRGGYFRLFAPKHGPRDWRRMALAYASVWRGPAPARRAFELYEKVLAGKWKSFQVTSRSATALAGRGDDGYFLVRLDGARLTSLEGLPSSPGAESAR